MFAFRALFWFCVVCALVPFKQFDLADGEVQVDRAALMERLASLPAYCDDHTEVCRQARALMAQAARDGAQAARHIVAVIQSRSAES